MYSNSANVIVGAGGGQGNGGRAGGVEGDGAGGGAWPIRRLSYFRHVMCAGGEIKK